MDYSRRYSRSDVTATHHALLRSSLFLAIPVLLLLLAGPCSAYTRPPARATLSLPFADDADDSTPEQVHVSLVGPNKIRVTWVTSGDAPSVVDYDTSPGGSGDRLYSYSGTGGTASYTYMLYKSGQLHDVVIGPLEPGTNYSYRLSGNPTREYTLRTPPAGLPLTFVIVGDLGQTGWTKTTLDHVEAADYDVLLLPGDLSYADFLQSRWDSFGRLVEPLASTRPWMVTHGNHDVERIPLVEPRRFVAYNARWRMPYEESGSGSNLYYSFDVAAGAVHVLMLGSYTDFHAGSDQYKWLVSDLAKVDRNNTPWVLVLIHAPWYNTNTAHKGEGEDMRKAMEDVLYRARVDVVFAGHVHAYERFDRVYKNHADPCGPMHITIGDGGNREGLASEYQDPKPSISLFQEASFGHGRFDVINATHASWRWHRNDDDVAVVADEAWVVTLSANPTCRGT